MEQRIEGGVKLCRIQALVGKGSDKQTLDALRLECPRQKIGEPYAKETRPIMKRTDERREKLLKRIAIGEEKPGKTRRMVRGHQIAEGSPRIIAHPGNGGQGKSL